MYTHFDKPFLANGGYLPNPLKQHPKNKEQDDTWFRYSKAIVMAHTEVGEGKEALGSAVAALQVQVIQSIRRV